MSKILEKFVHSQFYDFLNSNFKQTVWLPSQLSTVSALANFADEVLLLMESEDLCGAVFLDLTKAFDTVNQPRKSCCPSCRLSMFRSEPYSGSSHIWVIVKSGLPVMLCLTFSGWPLGRHRGVFWFILVYINDLPLAIENYEVTLYAGDPVLTCTTLINSHTC